ncbi:uncharacterized protein MCYG_02318 [Microsporum canis CBS 113480]|uniref:Uncharacterized protein n=1 Tax=Arthroderma otae (strain ATCC MYA-4605 / CBS 113480) TaxID=554155 RepID=C5FJ78_ARTOC|nr:uncharacterized protein MCYG_02318 [Microsporum canis CBS 113480]EEQ29499.1 predicted protein [Microsporum canis CBS 113480]
MSKQYSAIAAVRWQLPSRDFVMFENQFTASSEYPAKGKTSHTRKSLEEDILYDNITDGTKDICYFYCNGVRRLGIPISSTIIQGQGLGVKCRFSTLTAAFKHLDKTWPDETTLGQNQRDELFVGRFPYTFSGEIITIRATPEKYYRLLHAFDATATESEKRMLVLLGFDKDFATTTIRNGQVILH